MYFYRIFSKQTFTYIIQFIIHICFTSQLFSELHFHLSGGQPLLTSPESCCTPAVLFRRSQAQAMASELGQSLLLAAGPDHAKDHILDESRFRGRQTDLNLVVHIGWFSVLRQRTVPTGELF